LEEFPFDDFFINVKNFLRFKKTEEEKKINKKKVFWILNQSIKYF